MQQYHSSSVLSDHPCGTWFKRLGSNDEVLISHTKLVLLTHATLDIDPNEDEDTETATVVYIEYFDCPPETDGENTYSEQVKLCALRPKLLEQFSLVVALVPGRNYKLTQRGPHQIHLIGSLFAVHPSPTTKNPTVRDVGVSKKIPSAIDADYSRRGSPSSPEIQGKHSISSGRASRAPHPYLPVDRARPTEDGIAIRNRRSARDSGKTNVDQKNDHVVKDLEGSHKIASSSSPKDNQVEYQDLVLGKGDAANFNSKVSVRYFLRDSKNGEMLSNNGAANLPVLTFNIGDKSLPKGFHQALYSMRLGGTRFVSIPKELGFGAQGSERFKVPENTDLSLEVKLCKIH